MPGHTIETFPAAVQAVVDTGHEIGHHGWRHIPPVALTRTEEEAELVRGNEAIKRISAALWRRYTNSATIGANIREICHTFLEIYLCFNGLRVTRRSICATLRIKQQEGTIVKSRKRGDGRAVS